MQSINIAMLSNQCNNGNEILTCQTLDWKGSLRRGLLPRGNLRTWEGFWCKNICGQSFSQTCWCKIILVKVFVKSAQNNVGQNYCQTESYGFSPSASLCPNPDPTALSSLLLPSLTPAPVQSASASALSTEIISISIVNLDNQHQHQQHRSLASALST